MSEKTLKECRATVLGDLYEAVRTIQTSMRFPERGQRCFTPEGFLERVRASRGRGQAFICKQELERRGRRWTLQFVDKLDREVDVFAEAHLASLLWHHTRRKSLKRRAQLTERVQADV